MDEFTVKDSGQRQEFASGMRRDVQDDKVLWSLIYSGPMLERWAKHLTAGARKYGPNNWLLAQGQEELDRFRDSAARHFAQWMRGDRDEDHGAAVFFNINGAEYVRDRMNMLYALSQEAGEQADQAAVQRLLAGTDVEPENEVDDIVTEAAKAYAEMTGSSRDLLLESAVREMIEEGLLIPDRAEDGTIVFKPTDKWVKEMGEDEVMVNPACDCSPDVYRVTVDDPDSPVNGRALLGSFSKCDDVWYAWPPGTDPRKSGLTYELDPKKVQIGAHVAESLDDLMGEASE